MADSFRIFLMGLKAGADPAELERYLEHHLNITDEKTRKTVIFDTPSLLAQSESFEWAGKVRADLDGMGCRVEVKRLPGKAPAPVVERPPVQPSADSLSAGAGSPTAGPPAATPPAMQYPSDMELMLLGIRRRTPKRPWLKYIMWGMLLIFTAMLGFEVIYISRHQPVPRSDQLAPVVIKIDGPDIRDGGGLSVHTTITNTMPKVNNPGSDLFQAIDLLKQGEIEQAIPKIESWIAAHPDDREAREVMAYALTMTAQKEYTQGKYDEAMNSMERANDISPDDPSVMAQLGALKYSRKDYENAIYYLERALEYGSKDLNVHVLLAVIYYYYRDDMEKAEKHLDAAIEADSSNKQLIAFRDKIRRERSHEDNMDEASGGKFIVKYEGIEDKNAGYTVLYELERAYSSIGYDLGEYPNNPITVILYTQQQFQDIVNAPHWAGGLFDGRIRLPVAGLPSRDDDNLRRLIYHEYTHAVIHRLTSGNCPVWLNEGLAQVMQERSGASRDPWMSIEYLRKGPIPSLNQLSRPFVNLSQEQALTAYVESYYATQYFIETYGMTGVRSLLEELDGNKPFKKAFYDSTGTEFNVFEERFNFHLKTIVE